ncbi:MAG: DMT family transporter [Carbonactinosporaceae bacterium]
MAVQSSATGARRIALPGAGWALLGMLGFSFTFPATRLALTAFDPVVVGIGRAVVAATIGLGCLAAARAPRPAPGQWVGLLAVALGCVVGFPLCTALALRDVSSSHAAVVIGLLPVATALVATVRVGERPSRGFWVAATVGSLAVCAFTVLHGEGGIRLADGYLVLALVSAAVGYAEGGRLAREMPGWRVIAWALALALPLTLPVAALAVAASWSTVASPHGVDGLAVAGFGYVAVVSMFLAFFAWYRGLAMAGVAKASQIQLAQPICTLVWSAALLGERLGVRTLGAALVVLVCVSLTQRARVRNSATGRGRAGSADSRNAVAAGSDVADGSRRCPDPRAGSDGIPVYTGSRRALRRRDR